MQQCVWETLKPAIHVSAAGFKRRQCEQAASHSELQRELCVTFEGGHVHNRSLRPRK